MSENILVYIGARIRDLRKEKGLSQEQLGEKAGFHFSYIGGIERAEKNISLLNLAKVATALDTEVSELFRYAQSTNFETTDKEDELTEILQILIRLDLNELRRVKAIIKEVIRS